MSRKSGEADRENGSNCTMRAHARKFACRNIRIHIGYSLRKWAKSGRLCVCQEWECSSMRAALLPPSQALVLSLFCSTHCFLLPITLVHGEAGGKRPKQASTSEHLRHYMHCTQKHTHTTHTRRHTTHTDSNAEEHGWNEKKSSFPFLKVCCLPRTWLGNRYPTPSAGGTCRCRRANQSEKGRGREKTSVSRSLFEFHCSEKKCNTSTAHYV